MSNEYDFTRVGRQMPYDVPDGFFDEMEKNVWEQVKDDMVKTEAIPPSVTAMPHRSRMRVLKASILAIAASIALVVVLNIFPKGNTDTLADVDQAFAQLSVQDQDYLLAVYQDDLFLEDSEN